MTAARSLTRRRPRPPKRPVRPSEHRLDRTEVSGETAAAPSSAPIALSRVAAHVHGHLRPLEPRSLLDLQRTAGNAAVARVLRERPSRPPVQREQPSGGAAQAPAPAAPAKRVSYVFLMGSYKNDSFYRAARAYFTTMVPSAQMVTGTKTLADIIGHVNGQGQPVDTLYVVSHANQEGNLSFSMDAADLAKDLKDKRGRNKPRTEYKEIKKANEEGTLPAADVSLVDAQTRIMIKGCNIGRSTLMLDELDKAFGGEATVTAPTHKQEYRITGTKKSPVYQENLSDLFVEEPGTASKAKPDLQAAFAAKYPHVDAVRWPSMVRKATRVVHKDARWTWDQPNPPADDEKSVFARLKLASTYPKAQGWTWTYAGRTVDGDQYRYTVEAERATKDGTEYRTLFVTAPIPPTDDELIAKAKAEHGRPDACTWSAVRTVTKGRLVVTVYSERTQWSIAGTVMDESGPYSPPAASSTWYSSSTHTP